jgi:ATP synthase protein I
LKEETRLIVWGSIPAVLVGVITILVLLYLEGGFAARSAVLGAVLVLLFFAFGQYVVGRVLATKPELGLGVAMLVYLTQLGVLLILIRVLRDVNWLDGRAFGISIITGTLAWTLGSVFTLSRHKTTVIEVTDPKNAQN